MGLSTLHNVDMPCVGGDGVGCILSCWLVSYMVSLLDSIWFVGKVSRRECQVSRL